MWWKNVFDVSDFYRLSIIIVPFNFTTFWIDSYFVHMQCKLSYYFFTFFWPLKFSLRPVMKIIRLLEIFQARTIYSTPCVTPNNLKNKDGWVLLQTSFSRTSMKYINALIIAPIAKISICILYTTWFIQMSKTKKFLSKIILNSIYHLYHHFES